jgi:carbamoyltransferase
VQANCTDVDRLIAEHYRLAVLLVNTSFNVRGEPIVCSPEDAFRCFMGTDIERLVIGNFMLRKEEQNMDLSQVYKDRFELD